MKKTPLLLLLLVGCHDDGSYEVYVDPWYVAYSNGHPVAAASVESYEECTMEALINDHRVAAGLDALVVDLDVEDLARAHSIHMELHFFVDSVNPEGDCPGNRADIAGVYWLDYGEIIGEGSYDPYEMFSIWLDTPAHDLVDDPFWTHMGVGYNYGYWTADFVMR